jgi:hypothetical protein
MSQVNNATARGQTKKPPTVPNGELQNFCQSQYKSSDNDKLSHNIEVSNIKQDCQ